ncbi:MAG: hypothetical protein K0S16_2007 [Moraxellaceae bacterium]|nr:hypothetical protein [Moraxellaceae bacterium]
MIRATPEKLAEIRAVLEKLDRPLKNLRISVRRRATASTEGSGVTGRGRVTVRDGKAGGRVDIRAGSDSRNTQDEQRYSIAAIEGETVFIATGSEIPVPVVSSTPRGEILAGPVYVPAQSGFEVRPRLQPGGSVLLEVTVQQAEPGPGAIRREVTRTQVQARLGAWTTLAGIEREESLRQEGLSGRVERQRHSSVPIEILVEELP